MLIRKEISNLEITTGINSIKISFMVIKNSENSHLEIKHMEISYKEIKRIIIIYLTETSNMDKR